jgi:hypothetical protein
MVGQALPGSKTMNAKVAGVTIAALVLMSGNSAHADTCFRTQDMRNHTKVDNDTIYVGVSIRDVYRVRAKSCFVGMTSSDPLVIATTASTGLVCKPLDLDLGVRRGGPGAITSRCIVDSIAKLTPAEVAAIPKKLRP